MEIPNHEPIAFMHSQAYVERIAETPPAPSAPTNFLEKHPKLTVYVFLLAMTAVTFGGAAVIIGLDKIPLPGS